MFLNFSPLARITLSHTSFRDLEEKDEEEVKVLVPAKDLTFNKKKISSDGMPSVEKEKLENLMHALSTRNDVAQRFVWFVLYC